MVSVYGNRKKRSRYSNSRKYWAMLAFLHSSWPWLLWYLSLQVSRFGNSSKKKRAIKKFLMSADNALFVRLGLTIELSPGTLLKDSVRGTNFIYLNSWKLGWKKMSLKAYTITLLESVKLSDYLTVTQKAFPWLQ